MMRPIFSTPWYRRTADGSPAPVSLNRSKSGGGLNDSICCRGRTKKARFQGTLTWDAHLSTVPPQTLLGGDLPALVTPAQGEAHRLGGAVEEVCAVLLDEVGAVPGLEAPYHVAGGVKDLAQPVRLPLPGVLHFGEAGAVHGNAGHLHQLAFR